MSTRVALAVCLALVVLSSGVIPVVGVGDAPPGHEDALAVTGSGADDADHRASGDAALRMNDDTVSRTGDALAQYKVSLNNVTIETWLLRNSTVRNATVERVVVRNATSTDGRRTNVTLTNATVGRFVVERARLTNVTARKLVVRNKSVLSVPGGGLIDPNIENRTIERHWTRNATVAGVVIDRIVVDAAVLCGNTSLGQRAERASAFDPRNGEDKPAVSVQNGTVEQALVVRGQASNWSVGSVNQSQATNATLPDACSRGG
jgi:hypothetical protein